ncbi:hypothetical protein COY07_05640 [Candidatus Peregrinibacteria bacterium CG_4_10_14_0_2_um_filter_43_11]|nr:MAG: hypothetical protein COY07_05640 [Candidatus Peregrinibacteria bacterium CG_4_10_14_0_2_um_filter_43_11]
MFNFRSTITVKLLSYFLLNPEEKNYLNELARLLKVDSGNLDRKIKKLEQEGVFVSEKRGNQRYYFLNKKYPLLKELKKIFEAKYSLAEKITSVLKKIKGVKEAYFFGSYATDSLREGSDIDLLIVGRHKTRDVQEKILEFQRFYKREFNIINITEDELRERKKNKDPFITHLFSNQLIKII